MSEYDERRGPYPMRIQIERGSAAERRYYKSLRRYDNRHPERAALAAGVKASPANDLRRRGGKTVRDVVLQNIYLGRSNRFAAGDVEHIDAAILRALRDPRLAGIIQQYIDDGKVSYDMAPTVLEEADTFPEFDEPSIQDKVVDLFDQGRLATGDLGRTCFNLILEPGTVLSLGNLDSTEGLGGYHGSVNVFRDGRKVTLYYSANVYSELTPQRRNGIVAFDDSWKNVVATLYHELAEFQTDPDVGEAIRRDDNRFVGWNSDFGEEIGDQPIAANALREVFREILTQPDNQSTPLQLLYSNRAHGAEEPV